MDQYIPHDDERRSDNLENFHGKTPKEIKEKRWYHGTNADFNKFNRSHRGAIYLTSDPNFASMYAEEYQGGEKPSVMPVHVRAEHPFDYENPNHLDAIKQKLSGLLKHSPHVLDEIKEGNWGTIESYPVQQAIKSLGHDGYFIEEHDSESGYGGKNLAVYDPSQIKSATGNQGTFDPSNPDITKRDGGDVEGEGITAYHGSPHDFEQFDTSKIGTGEGAQAYGHGLYFAGNEDVARDYRDRLGRQEETSGETMADQYVIPRHFYQDTSEEELAENMKEAARWSEQQIFDKGKMHYVFDDGSMLIHDDDEVRAVQKHPGHMYEVHIKADPNKHFLDWDKPLREQPHIMKAIDEHIGDPDIVMQQLFGHDNATGGDLHDRLGGNHKPAAVAQKLSSMGIRGIRYLDAGSRGDNELPTHNFVVFDHNHVSVKRKYAHGGEVEEYPLRDHTDWEEAHDYEKSGGKLHYEDPRHYLEQTEPLDMDRKDKGIISHFEKQIEHGEKLDPVAIYPDSHPNGRHRAHAAKNVGVKKIPVVTWPQKNSGGSIVEKALMLTSRKA